jgi:hypothetical protein
LILAGIARESFFCKVHEFIHCENLFRKTIVEW